MNTNATFVVVGAGLAGAKAAEALRRDGFEGHVVLVGEEPEPPYDRPPLSKGYLTGRDEAPPYLRDATFYADNDIELVTGTAVTALEPNGSTVTLASGERLRYDRLLLATGSSPRTLDVPGGELDGVRYLRTLQDAQDLRTEVGRAERVVVVGGGWIGTEMAAAVRQLGRPVTLVHRGQLPLVNALGPEVARVYRDVHADNGVRLVSGDVTEVLGRHSAEGVRLASGDTVEGDLVVVGIGARPRTELAAAAGLAVDDGVIVDEHLCTSAPGVFAAGDVARAWHPLFGSWLRVDHWANALNQGAVAAGNMMGRSVPYDRVPYLYSDQYDIGMEYSGHAPRWDSVVFRGDPRDREFIAFWLYESRVVAGMNVNIWDVVADVQDLVRSGVATDPRSLADTAVPLEVIVGRGTAERVA